MSNINQKAGYLKGLAEGCHLDEGQVRDRLLKGMVDLLGDMAEAVAELQETQNGDAREEAGRRETLADMVEFLRMLREDDDEDDEYDENDFCFSDEDEDDEDFDEDDNAGRHIRRR
jgi:hypothetical protein